ncbi:MAG: pantoate--beta-alanine ligase [Acidimicrobiia bacterium]|nr:MAG: pantoate--beta-alanine ligase [Acidimicrobiia bacterium]
MKIVSTFRQARDLSQERVGLVPTMGYLHEGHLSLIEAASDGNDTVVVSIFVNPLQFNETTDLDSYPRDIERDASLAHKAGADILFVPDAEYMYPAEPRVTVSVSEVSGGMEGAHRPGHFAGVATVVAKLFAGIQPDSAYFGRKDAQQLAVVRTMGSDLGFPINVHGMPIVREFDGLALSSRNVKIDPALRTSARSLSSGLSLAADAFEAGEMASGVLKRIVGDRLGAEQSVRVEYVEVARSKDAAIVDTIDSEVFLAVAARVGNVRLIDNVHLDPGTGAADRGLRLKEPSILYGGS